MHPFNQRTIDLLKSLGYHYLVIDKAKSVAYARKESIEKEKLDFLSLQEFELHSFEVQHVKDFPIQQVLMPA